MVMHRKEEETGCLHHYPVGERWEDRLACLPAQHPLETTWEEGHGVPLGGLFQAHWGTSQAPITGLFQPLPTSLWGDHLIERRERGGRCQRKNAVQPASENFTPTTGNYTRFQKSWLNPATSHSPSRHSLE